jgi:hypothetical protein
MDIKNGAVGLLVGFIMRGIAAIRAERNTGKVTQPSLFSDLSTVSHTSPPEAGGSVATTGQVSDDPKMWPFSPDESRSTSIFFHRSWTFWVDAP